MNEWKQKDPGVVRAPARNPSTQKAKWREFKFEASMVQYSGPFSITVKKKSVFLGCNLMVEDMFSMYKGSTTPPEIDSVYSI